MGRALPIAEIRLTQIAGHASNWSQKKLDLQASMILGVEYFNSGIMSFEPLIEKWPFTITLKVRRSGLCRKLTLLVDVLQSETCILTFQ